MMDIKNKIAIVCLSLLLTTQVVSADIVSGPASVIGGLLISGVFMLAVVGITVVTIVSVVSFIIRKIKKMHNKEQATEIPQQHNSENVSK